MPNVRRRFKYKKDKNAVAAAVALRQQKRAEKPVEEEVRMGKVLRLVIPFEAPLVAVEFYGSPDAPGSMETPVDALDEELPREQPINEFPAERAIREEAIAEARREVIIGGAMQAYSHSAKLRPDFLDGAPLEFPLDHEVPLWIRIELAHL